MFVFYRNPKFKEQNNFGVLCVFYVTASNGVTWAIRCMCGCLFNRWNEPWSEMKVGSVLCHCNLSSAPLKNTEASDATCCVVHACPPPIMSPDYVYSPKVKPRPMQNARKSATPHVLVAKRLVSIGRELRPNDVQVVCFEQWHDSIRHYRPSPAALWLDLSSSL